MYYFTSDLHLGNNYNLILNKRPFKDYKQFERYLVKTWNSQVAGNDIIYIIGDLVDCHNKDNDTWKKSLNIVKKINSKIILIMGNNEERVVKYFFNNDFEAFRQYCLKLGYLDVKYHDKIKIKHRTFYLTHKPINHSKTMLTLFGHSHNAMGIYKSFGFNIGCDLSHFHLYDENDIMHFLDMKTNFWDKDENLKLI